VNNLKVEIDPTIFLTYRAKDIQTKFVEEPTCVEVDDDPKSAMAALDQHSFDQAPVTENGVIVGWILRTDMTSKKPISQTYRVLSQSDLISADAPLNDLLQKLVTQHLVFIVGASGIEGFAVQSDIERHVSRAHLYLLISGLEILIAKILSKDLVEPAEVIPYMSKPSKKHWELAKAAHDDANPIEYLDLNGLGKAFLIEKGALNHLGISERDWKRYIFKLKRIRDWVAHSNTQEMRREPFPDVVKRMKRTEEFVRKLVEY
jgi:CBS domain-containing protein